MAVVFYYRDIPKSVPEPDLNTLDICGKVTPQVVVNWKANRDQEDDTPGPAPDNDDDDEEDSGPAPDDESGPAPDDDD